MSGDPFSVDLAELDDVVARLTGLIGFLGDTFDAIDRQVRELRDTSWQSIGAQAYSEAHRAWVAEAREFAEGVADVTAAGKAAHGRYTEAMKVNSAMARG